jgi:glycosyltransferase involved in cell wall biosynthesis
VCAIGVAYRDGAVCHRCSGRNTWPGARLRCRGALTESAVYATALARQQPRILAATDRFVTLSEATRTQLGRLGLPLERADVISNPLSEEAFRSASAAHEGRYALCVGRLVEEKGFDLAVQAARAAGVPLKIVGRGPEEARLRSLSHDADVELLGELEPAELERVRSGAAVQLAPSRCEEQSPYAVLEAMAAGVPVLASQLGGLPELAGADASLPPGDAAAWAESLTQLWSEPEERRRRGDLARTRAWERAAPERVHAALMGVYERAGAKLDAPLPRT